VNLKCRGGTLQLCVKKGPATEHDAGTSMHRCSGERAEHQSVLNAGRGLRCVKVAPHSVAYVSSGTSHLGAGVWSTV